MKKFLMIVAAFVLICIAITAIGPLIVLGIGAILAYHSFKSFLKTPSLLGKLWWGIVGLCGVSIAFSSLPSIIGIIALGLLYYGYKEWKKEKAIASTKADPGYQDFQNFEKEWETIMNKHK